MPDALLQLAALYGIAANYYDIWGKRHEASAEALIALLGAMGVAADSPEAIDRALREREAAPWSSIIAPVHVLRAHRRPWLLRLALPPRYDNATLGWRVEEEAGTLHAGALQPAELPTPERRDAGGEPRIAREWRLDAELPLGYHRLYLRHAGEDIAESLLIVAPAKCFQPPVLEQGGRVWGGAVQLYSLRSARNWGIGDYGDLCELVKQWGARGGGILGVNPLHALFPHNPMHCSPYSPSSRLFKNVLYIAVDRVEGYEHCAAAQTYAREALPDLKALRESPLVEYGAVASHKFAVLEKLYAHFRDRELEAGTELAGEFRAFQQAGGAQLRRHALFEAIQAALHRGDASIWGWPVWPEIYRTPDAASVRQFEDEHLDRVEFFEYLQWLADRQLAEARACARRAHMKVGLYEDLAVSIDRGGAESWANQELYALSASVGAPPDELSLQGQDWGLPPLIPERLRASQYEPFIATLRATMRHAGALRIDHVMGLARLFWVPPGMKAAQGTYVFYPFEDLLGILALESVRHHCLVIGEDLGTVPDEVRAALHEHRVLSYRLLYFERREGGDFKSPGEYPVEAIVAATTHDLPTLAGWWEGCDIDARAELNLFPDPAMKDAQWASRIEDRGRLLRALERDDRLPEGVSADPAQMPQMSPALAASIAGYLAAAAAKVGIWQMEDVLLVREQANIPGTTDQHPNWRRKLPVPLEALAEQAHFLELTRRFSAERSGPQG
jgi:(1->4)-alpha-D-glucan 1-alpha-D-glucosylmutase